MWKSRIDRLPPSQFFADLLQHLRNLYPGAAIDEALARTMRDIWIAEWRNGQNAQDTAKATCSCDGKSIVPSAGAGRELGKRLARPPKGAKRGDFIAPESLQEVAPLASARREAEKYAQAFDRVRAAALKLLQTKGWTSAKGVRLQKLRTLLQEIKTKHDAAVARYKSQTQSRRDAQQPELYEKPLGALGLSLRPDELPEPPPPKEKKPKETKAPKEKKPKETKAPKEKKPAAEKKAKKAAARAVWEPPANLHQTGLAGNFSITVEAVPNPDFASSSGSDGQHRATVKMPARTYPVGTLGAARALLRAFIDDNGLGGGNMPPAAGRVRRDGKPFVHISYNGRIWRVDGKWKETGQELDEAGQPKEASPAVGDLVKFTAPGPDGPMNVAGTVKRVLPDGRLEIKSQNHGYFTLLPSELTKDCGCNKSESKPTQDEKPTKKKSSRKTDSPPSTDAEPKQKGKRQKKTPPAKEQPKTALSESEAEELANLFAAARSLFE